MRRHKPGIDSTINNLEYSWLNRVFASGSDYCAGHTGNDFSTGREYKK